MKCAKCMMEIPEGSKFCENCGAPVPPARPVQPQPGMYQGAVPPQPMRPAQPVQPQQMQQPVRPVQPQTGMYQGAVPPQPMRPVQPQPAMYQRTVPPVPPVPPQRPLPHYQAPVPPQPKKKSKGVLVGAILAGILVLTAVVLVIAVALSSGDEDSSVKAGNNGKVEDDNPIRVTPTPEVTDPVVIPTGETSVHTVMIYMIGSDLESEGGAASADIEEMLDADWGTDVQVILQTGGCSDWQNSDISDGRVQRFLLEKDGLTEIEDLGSISMVDPDALSDFIMDTAASYPAENYTLVLWDHGGGVPIGFGVDELDPYDTMEEVEIGEALEGGGIHFNSVIFDACNMCTLEVAMAIHEYSDYMVAAESYVSGIGMYYTNFLNTLAGDSSASPMEYCEVVITDYMDSLDEIYSVGSMSLINMDKVESVYSAYIDYIDTVATQVQNGDYANFAKIRSSSGLYEGTDSVDIITLATSYSTTASSPLMNAVVNAVSYTDSDFLYGHGLATYLPYNYAEYYENARASLVGLEYDDAIINFYDSFVSVKMAYMGEDYVNEYTGSWFDDMTAYSYTDSSTEASEYDLGTREKNGYTVLDISDDLWESISTIEAGVVVMLDDVNGLVLGQDYFYQSDEEGDIIAEIPDYWVCVNGNLAGYVCTDIYEDDTTGEWSQSGAVYAFVNGQEVLLMIYYDEDYPQGTPLGYIPYDFETGESTEGKVLTLNDNYVVDLCYPIMDTETGDVIYEAYEEEFYAKDMELTYEAIDFTGYDVCVYYVVYDIYGNSYTTDDFWF